uniref:Uncharacterized protein n=1 Tax=Stomoxys calcitrans TaxID=35570 RepID=A0A1I8Q8E8_STOCA
MKPLEEYMLFTKSGADNITVINPQGVRSAQCVAKFDITEQPSQEPMVNVSMKAENWVDDPPLRIPYVAKYVYDVSTKEDSTQVVFITLTSLFVIIVICCLIEVYRSHLAYKRRIERETDEDIIWSKERATKMHESPGVGGQPYVYKALPAEEKKPGTGAPLVGILKNGSIKRNGDLPPTHVDTPIREEDEEETNNKDEQHKKQEQSQTPSKEVNETPKSNGKGEENKEAGASTSTEPPKETTKDLESNLTQTTKPEDLPKTTTTPTSNATSQPEDSSAAKSQSPLKNGTASTADEPISNSSPTEPLIQQTTTQSPAAEADVRENGLKTSSSASTLDQSTIKTPPNADKGDRKASVKRQVSWGPPTVAEADAGTVKVKKISKPNGYYNATGAHVKTN